MLSDPLQTEEPASAIRPTCTALHADDADPVAAGIHQSSDSFCSAASQLAVAVNSSNVAATLIDGDQGCPNADAFVSAASATDPSLTVARNAELDQKAEETPVCRICLDGASSGPLRRLCACQGTIGSLHRHCLTRWLGLSKKQHCELCLQPLPVLIEQPGLVQYIRDGPKRCHCIVLLDLLSLLLMLPLIVYCNLLSVTALQHFRELQYLRLRQYSFWEICFGIVLTPFVLSGFLLWVWFMCRGHRTDYRRWCLEHRRVTLCESESSPAEL